MESTLENVHVPEVLIAHLFTCSYVNLLVLRTETSRDFKYV